MHKLGLILLLGLIMGCATSGSVNKTQFIDSKYPFSVTFPKDYEPRSSGKNSTERVSAVRYQRELDVIGGLILLKPVFVVSVFEATQPFSEFIEDKKERFFEPRYYFKYNVVGTKDIKVNECPVHLIYFSSSVATTGDYIISIKGNNLGITGFIHLVNYYIKIEYIANKSNFKQEDFEYVLNNLIITNNPQNK